MLKDFVNMVCSKKGKAYLFGGQNDGKVTKDVINGLVARFGKSHYYSASLNADKWLGTEGYFDCSGLIVYSLIKTGHLPNGADYTASGLYTSLCVPTKRQDLVVGDLCFNKTTSGIVHVGVYVGNNEAVHARGTMYGVVQTTIDPYFNTFGRLKMFINESHVDQFRDEMSKLCTKIGADSKYWCSKKDDDLKAFVHKIVTTFKL